MVCCTRPHDYSYRRNRVSSACVGVMLCQGQASPRISSGSHAPPSPAPAFPSRAGSRCHGFGPVDTPVKSKSMSDVNVGTASCNKQGRLTCVRSLFLACCSAERISLSRAVSDVTRFFSFKRRWLSSRTWTIDRCDDPGEHNRTQLHGKGGVTVFYL